MQEMTHDTIQLWRKFEEENLDFQLTQQFICYTTINYIYSIHNLMPPSDKELEALSELCIRAWGYSDHLHLDEIASCTTEVYINLDMQFKEIKNIDPQYLLDYLSNNYDLN